MLTKLFGCSPSSPRETPKLSSPLPDQNPTKPDNTRSLADTDCQRTEGSDFLPEHITLRRFFVSSQAEPRVQIPGNSDLRGTFSGFGGVISLPSGVFLSDNVLTKHLASCPLLRRIHKSLGIILPMFHSVLYRIWRHVHEGSRECGRSWPITELCDYRSNRK